MLSKMDSQRKKSMLHNLSFRWPINVSQEGPSPESGPGAYRRVGGVESQQADFRLVTATHRNLQAMVAEGSFRRDLFYRISAFPVELPALRERTEDFPLLIESLLSRLSPEPVYKLAPATLACLQQYAFPGNVRELRNIQERAAYIFDTRRVSLGPKLGEVVIVDND